MQWYKARNSSPTYVANTANYNKHSWQNLDIHENSQIQEVNYKRYHAKKITLEIPDFGGFHYVAKSL